MATITADIKGFFNVFLEEGKKEAKKRKLTDFYPESVLKIIVDRFGRQQPEMLVKLTRKLCDMAIQTLTPEQLKKILNEISAQVSLHAL